jgi:hypothetical protein
MRGVFEEKMKAYQQAHRVTVFIDESGFAHDMPRKYGYAPRKERCLGIQDWHAKGRINVIGALRGSHFINGLIVRQLFEESGHKSVNGRNLRLYENRNSALLKNYLRFMFHNQFICLLLYHCTIALKLKLKRMSNKHLL